MKEGYAYVQNWVANTILKRVTNNSNAQIVLLLNFFSSGLVRRLAFFAASCLGVKTLSAQACAECVRVFIALLRRAEDSRTGNASNATSMLASQ